MVEQIKFFKCYHNTKKKKKKKERKKEIMNDEVKKRLSLRLKSLANSSAFACTKFPASARKSPTFEIKG